MLVQNEMSLGEFVNAFENAGRGNQFSRKGFEALYDYLSDFQDQMDSPLEFDVVGICCQFFELTYEEFEDECGNYDDERIIYNDNGFVLLME